MRYPDTALDNQIAVLPLTPKPPQLTTRPISNQRLPFIKFSKSASALSAHWTLLKLALSYVSKRAPV